jgi:hypothetical protein
MTELLAATWTPETPAGAAGEPLLLGAGAVLDESLEGVLVRLEAPVVTSANPDAPADYGQFEVDGGIRVGDWFPVPYTAAATDARNLGDRFGYLTGVVVQTYGDYVLMPRTADDMPLASLGDDDGDLVPNSRDNCPANANADQADDDKDRIGNACDPDTQALGPASDVSITELLYNPLGTWDDGEFIEVYNRGALPVWIGGWSFAGVDWTFGEWQRIEPGQALIVAAKPELYASLGAAALGPFLNGTGLDNAGETVVLKDATGAEVDAVAFKPGTSGWPVVDGAVGQSIEVSDPAADNGLPAAWHLGPAGGTPGVFPPPV